MSSSSDNHTGSPPSPELDIHTLAAAFLDEQLTESQWEYLSQKQEEPEFWKEWEDILKTEQAMLVALAPAENIISIPTPDTHGADESPGSHRPPIARWALGLVAAQPGGIAEAKMPART